MRVRKPKVGRPKLPRGTAKEVVLQSRVQPSEKEAYLRTAKSQGKALSTWIRDTLNLAAS